MASSRSLLPALAAASFVAVAMAGACGLVQDVDDLSQSGGAGGATQTAATGGSVSSTVDTTTASTGGGPPGATVASSAAATTGSGCVDPPCGTVAGDPCCLCGGPQCGANLYCDGTQHCQPCGAEGQPCCMGQCNPGQLVCNGANTCVQCGDVPEPCCNGLCNGEWAVCQPNDTCLHCCVLCQGDGNGDPTQGAGKAVDADDNGGDCAAAAKQYCDNLKGCNGGSPAQCCASSCVNAKGWGPCQP